MIPYSVWASMQVQSAFDDCQLSLGMVCWTPFARAASANTQNGPTVKSQIFVRYLISYFVLLKKYEFNTGQKFIFALRPSNFNVIFYQALKSMKISSYEPVSSQKYENGYRTKMCNFTVQPGAMKLVL